MQLALSMAKKSDTDIPVGAVIVFGEEVLAKTFNKKEKLNDVTAHAEILAIKKAAEKLNNWRLSGCELYVTLEPCPMCAWAVLNSGLKSVYFGAYDDIYGALGSKINLLEISAKKTKIYGGIMEKECREVLHNYFKIMRINQS